VDCLRAERVLSAGRDRTCRLWKVPEETQLVFRGHSASIDCAALITPTDFISGSEDG
jgi:ribosomal RNA-processing protein 9